MSRSVIVIDLDGTLTIDDRRVGYPERPVNAAVVRAAERARALGFGVCVLTARGMRTWNNDRAAVEQHVRPIAARWLLDNAVAHDDLVMGKPWCGPRGFSVDDRNLHVEEFVFRFTGPFADARVEVRGPAAEHDVLARVERWLPVVAYRYDPPIHELVAQDPLVGSADAAPTHVLTATAGARPAAWFSAHAESLTSDGPIEQEGWSLVPVRTGSP